MGVDESRDDVRATDVDLVRTAIPIPHADYVTIDHGEVGVQPLAGEHGEDLASPEDPVCGLVATGD
jgi:hypothetical protein